MPICAYRECDREAKYFTVDERGLCKPHQMTCSRWGSNTPQESFNQRVDKSRGANACWIWTAGTCGANGNLYGSFSGQCAHRVAYQFSHGPIPVGMEIDHTCHVYLCVNPAHLRLATSKQNKENLERGFGASGIRGVRLKSGRYEATIVHNRKHLYLGRFDTAEEAGEVARLKRLEMFTHNDVDRMVG